MANNQWANEGLNDDAEMLSLSNKYQKWQQSDDPIDREDFEDAFNEFDSTEECDLEAKESIK